MTWKSRIAALLLALCCLTAALTGCGKKQTDTAAPIDQPTQTQTAPEPVDDYEPTKGDKPYYVRVNLQAGTVTVYYRDESGYYSVPYKAMICSGGESTPRGHFKLTNWRQEWLGLVGDVYGHYCTQIKGNYLFHSVPYTEKYDKNSLQWEEYDRLGTVCSHGCIRLQLIDAKWIYDHMREIEEVELYDSDYPGPLGTPAIEKISGDTVRRGDTLVVLDAPDVLAKLEQARAAKDAAQAKQDEAMAGTRHEQVQAAYDMWQKAKAGLDIAVKSHRRVKELFEQGVLPEQKFDEAAAQLAAAQATEKAAHSQYQMAVNGARREDKAAAAAMVSRARGAVDEVESYVRETVLTAQADGEVSEIFPKAGELVGTGAPIINVAMMDKMWVTFNIREDMLGHIGMNRKFKARIPALGGREVELVTYYMKDLGSYAAWKATKTTGDYDLKTFEVRARPVKPVEGLRPGMSVIFPQQH